MTCGRASISRITRTARAELQNLKRPNLIKYDRANSRSRRAHKFAAGSFLSDFSFDGCESSTSIICIIRKRVCILFFYFTVKTVPLLLVAVSGIAVYQPQKLMGKCSNTRYNQSTRAVLFVENTALQVFIMKPLTTILNPPPPPSPWKLSRCCMC